LGYIVQLYCDFSGYTDMAIGCARMMGFKFPENLNALQLGEHHGILAALAHHPVAMVPRLSFLPLEIATRSIPAMLRVSLT